MTRYRYVETLRAAFNWGMRQGFISSNPAAGIKKDPNYNPRPRRALPEDDAERILVELPSPDREFCALALLAGLRRSEIVYLQWRDVDLKARTITIRPLPEYEHSPKSTRYRDQLDVVPIVDRLKQILAEFRSKSSQVFVFDNGHGKPLHSDPDSWTRRIKLRMLEIGVRSTIHELRHTFITNYARKGMNPLALRLIARHADLTTTLRYTHLSTEDLRKEMETVER